MITAILDSQHNNRVDIYFNSRLVFQPQYPTMKDVQVIISGNSVQIISKNPSLFGEIYEFDNNGNMTGPKPIRF